MKAKIMMVTACALTLGACADYEGRGYPAAKTVDRGCDNKHLSQLQSGVRGSPNCRSHTNLPAAARALQRHPPRP